MLLPIAVVGVVGWRRPHPLGIEGEGGVPVGDRLFIADSLDLGHKILRDRRGPHLGDPADPQHVARLLDPAVQRLRQEKSDFERIADGDPAPLRRKVVSHPAVDHDLLGAGQGQYAAVGTDESAARQRHGGDTENGRVGDRGRGLAGGADGCQRVGEKDERGLPTTRREHLPGGPIGFGRQDQPTACQPQRCRPRRPACGCLQRESVILERGSQSLPKPRGQALESRRICCRPIGDREDRVGDVPLTQDSLNRRERGHHERLGDLRRPQRKLPQPVTRQHLADPQTLATRAAGAPPQRAVCRHAGAVGEPQHERIPDSQPKRLGEHRIDRHGIRLEQFRRQREAQRGRIVAGEHGGTAAPPLPVGSGRRLDRSFDDERRHQPGRGESSVIGPHR